MRFSVTLILAITLLSAACAHPYAQTVVVNESVFRLVVGVSESPTTFEDVRYYAIPGNAHVAVDSVGHVNPPASRIAFFDMACEHITTEARDFGEDGGVLTVAADRQMSYQPGFTATGPEPERDYFDSCDEAAATF